jgi:hypothetical protein
MSAARRLAPLAGALLLAGLACDINLKALAPFPCGADGTCPEGFSESRTASDCKCESGPVTARSCTTDDDCTSLGAFYCKSSKCKACNDATRCGSACQACTPDLPMCDGTECVQCQKDADCLGTGATCSSSKMCQCATGTACGNLCVDLKTAPDNCGSCGKTCRTDQVCVNSSCTCDTGIMFCGASCAQCLTGQIPTCLTNGSYHCCDRAKPVYCEQYPDVCWSSDAYCESLIKCPDNSWNSCPDIAQRYNCTSKQCATCTAQCSGKDCGDDGCGGNCGQCPTGKACTVATGKCN